MIRQYFWLFLCVGPFIGCGSDGKQTREPPTNTLANDVESVLKRGTWVRQDGISEGVSWRFLDGGRVLINDGGRSDESYRWELLERDEGERSIRLKYWRPSESNDEYREWEFSFESDGREAQLKWFSYRGGRMKDSGGGLMVNNTP